MSTTSSNPSNEATVPIRYLITVGHPSPSGHETVRFEYAGHAPASLCTPQQALSLSPSYLEQRDKFLTSLINKHIPEISIHKPWHCVCCKGPAMVLKHLALPRLTPRPFAAPGFEPFIIGFVVPICRSGGTCHRDSKQLSRAMMQVGVGGGCVEVVSFTTCDECRQKSDVKLCGRCRTVAYCSVECQKKSWPHHKKNCQRIQKEREERAKSATQGLQAKTTAQQ